MYKLKLTNIYKQLKEEETEPTQEYSVFCDMDGVLTDFEKRFTSLNPEKLSSAQYQTKYGIEEFWNLIDSYKEKFWSEMSWMSDGKDLWEYIKKYNPILLSAPSRKSSSRYGKKLWVNKNLPGTELILSAAKKKQNYSGRNKILIDDRPDNIKQWRAQGGKGILHTNTQDTIKQLQAYGI
jgi:hypothetical protein